MFDISYEDLLERALSRVENLDKQEGSFIYDAIAPCVLELYHTYLYCNELEKRVFADTAYGEYLDRRVEERNIKRKKATFSQRKGIFNNTVPIGSKWGKEGLIFTVVSATETPNHYILKCEELGSIGNKYNGELINIDAVPNITLATIEDVILAGEDEETDEKLRQRYFNSFNEKSFGGNVADYKNKVLSINGVGQCKVIPCYNGAGTVKILILDSNNSIANNVLISNVKEFLDPTSNEGLGYGVAPIGHTVTVSTPTTFNIDISVKLEYENGFTFQNLQFEIINSIKHYFNQLIKNWSESDEIITRISHIISNILAIQGIRDVRSILLNGVESNITLTDKMPVLRGVVD